MRLAPALLAWTACAAPCGGAAALPPTLDVQWSAETSRGHYGESEVTQITTTTAAIKLRGQHCLAQLELPWLEVRTRAAQGGLPGQAKRGGSVERGQGDAWVKVGCALREAGTQQTGLDLTVKLKTRSGSAERGLGSGGTDMAVLLEWLQPLGALSAFGEIGYRRTGDVPGARPYHDPWSAQVGVLASASDGLEAGAYLDLRERIGSLGPLREFTAYGAWRLSAQRLQLHWMRGSTRASPEQALGLTWRLRF